MAESAVSFLLNQISVVLRDEQQLLGGLEREIEYIQNELGQMREFLRVADANEETNSNLKEWVAQLREISYDVQHVLDKYMLRHRRRLNTNGFIKKFHASIKNLKAQRQIALEIQSIKNRLENASKLQLKYKEMYTVMDQRSSSAISSYDGRCDALFLEMADVVGIQKSKEQILEWIWSMDGNGFEVISLVGMAGLGKTTLVKKVYDDELVRKHFNRHVWIVVSDYTDAKHILSNLIKKLVGEIKESPPLELECMSIDEMRNFIYEFLVEKDYIIVLDDVWNISIWEVIKFALPKRKFRGCIIITTRFNNIGNAACWETNHVYNLEPLPAEESKVLFYKKAFPRNPCPPYLNEYAESILKRCEGLPLAIVLIGELLATKNNSAEEWELFNRSLCHELESGSLRRVWKLLSLSYNDLPYNLKSCFLYLSIFPEGGLLEKEKIVRLWIAEGFVQSRQDRTVEQVAEDFLNELLSRSLIQVAEKNVDGRARAFHIHGLLQEYITSKARAQNMVTIQNGGKMDWPKKIRRLAIQKFVDFSIEGNNFEYLHSLLVLCDEKLVYGPIKELINKCRLLKVLDLRGAPMETIPEAIFKLYHLKYLCLRNTLVKIIPNSIKNLESLETLDLKNSGVTELPIEILKLHRLRHLLVYKYKTMSYASFDCIQSFKAPYNIGSCLPCLQKLCCIDVDGEVDGIRMVTELGKLTQLRRLSVAKLRSEDGKEFCASIAKLTSLRSLRIYSIEEGEKVDVDYALSYSGLPFLRTLVLCGRLEKVPRWIPSLHGLTTLYLGWSRLREDPLSGLERFAKPCAIMDSLCVRGGIEFQRRRIPEAETIVGRKMKRLTWVVVEKGCMPLVREWAMWDCKMLKELPQGMEHLRDLQVVTLGNMESKFVERVVEERRNGGDNWRLARVPNLRFGILNSNIL